MVLFDGFTNVRHVNEQRKEMQVDSGATRGNSRPKKIRLLTFMSRRISWGYSAAIEFLFSTYFPPALPSPIRLAHPTHSIYVHRWAGRTGEPLFLRRRHPSVSYLPATRTLACETCSDSSFPSLFLNTCWTLAHFTREPGTFRAEL